MRYIIYIFIFELFFGFNGKLLVLCGVSIRHWLFALTLLCLTGKAFSCLMERYRAIKQTRNLSVIRFLHEELRVFRRFDWIFLFFVLLHMIWIVIIPWMQQGDNWAALQDAVSAGAGIMITALYFPAVYLVRINKLELKPYRHFIMGCCIAVSFFHLFLYAAESIQRSYDHSVYFMERVFGAWSELVGRRCISPQILMPKYAVRIIYPMNIFVLMSFYFIIGKRQRKYFFWTLLNILALFTTGTRALLVGALAGAAVYVMSSFCLYHREAKKCLPWLKRFVVILLFMILADNCIFHGMNFTRLAASFSFSRETIESGQAQEIIWDSVEYTTESEIRGTTNSNSTRILQIKYYWNKFLEKPFWGQGFAIEYGYGFDMQGLVFLAKVGIVGLMLWIVFLLFLWKRILRLERKERGSALPAVYLIVSVLADVQFQVMFGSLTIAAAVFLFLELAEREGGI